MCRARDLVSEPGNVLTPKAFADACAGLAEAGLEVEVLDRAELTRLGMNALLGVAQGSAEPPFVAVMRWNGGGAEPPLALVGKGVCFDTGGISIKPAQGMEEMKADMGGAAAVFGTMLALADRKARANVVGVVGLVENMPSANAQRPGDVVRSMAGKTIEVVNTDAEGRLVLCDVLHYTRERFKPKAMIDLATLTGAVIVALGHEQAGLFSNDETLAADLTAAAAGKRRAALAPAAGQGVREAHQVRHRRHQECRAAAARPAARRVPCSCSSSSATRPGRISTSPPWPGASRDLPLSGKGATGFGVRLLDRLVADKYEATA